MSCNHKVLQLDPSPFAELAGYAQPTATIRAAAETSLGRIQKSFVDHSTQIFPAPLVLPHDELNYDPDCSVQSVKSWSQKKARNKLGKGDGRDTLYIARVPDISKEVKFMSEWTVPTGFQDGHEMVKGRMESPDGELFVEYLRAFYHGMDVRILPSPLSWTSWSASKKASTAIRPSRGAALPKYIGLCDSSTKNVTRIRVRRPPDSIFSAQLNLDDILDTAISILPADAYALLLLVDHDIYENEEDDFCCGRAYGGSRVAVVQTARYNPTLDEKEGIDRAHIWPMSHCKIFVDRLCSVEDVVPKPASKRQAALSKTGAMRKAVDAASSYTPITGKQDEIKALWFTRLARTTSHEVGHCFGIAHCTYYACNMQGCAGMKEDLRQPPYLCPVCESKVGHAVAVELRGGQDKAIGEWVQERNEALKSFCEVRECDGAMWRGLRAWLEARREEL
jgi:archaemetzincin